MSLKEKLKTNHSTVLEHTLEEHKVWSILYVLKDRPSHLSRVKHTSKQSCEEGIQRTLASFVQMNNDIWIDPNWDGITPIRVPSDAAFHCTEIKLMLPMPVKD